MASTGQISATTNLMGRLSTLLAWHLADPVVSRERLRNDLVFERYQHNRNPFVDRPEWADAVFAPVLQVTMQTNGVQLHWPGEYATATVEVSATLGGWLPLTNALTLMGGRWTVTVPATGARRFFRFASRVGRRTFRALEANCAVGRRVMGGYPPDLRDETLKTVLRQAKLLCSQWATN